MARVVRHLSLGLAIVTAVIASVNPPVNAAAYRAQLHVEVRRTRRTST